METERYFGHGFSTMYVLIDLMDRWLQPPWPAVDLPYVGPSVWVLALAWPEV